jgi:hypothetical protein
MNVRNSTISSTAALESKFDVCEVLVGIFV